MEDWKADLKLLGYSQIFREFKTLKTLLQGDARILGGHGCHWIYWWCSTPLGQLCLAGVHVNWEQPSALSAGELSLLVIAALSKSNHNPFVLERFETWGEWCLQVLCSNPLSGCWGDLTLQVEDAEWETSMWPKMRRCEGRDVTLKTKASEKRPVLIPVPLTYMPVVSLVKKRS